MYQTGPKGLLPGTRSIRVEGEPGLGPRSEAALRASQVDTGAHSGTSIYVAVSPDGKIADEIDLGPTVPGSIATHRLLVAVCTLLVAVAAIGYSLHQPKVFQAHASIAIAQPSQGLPTATGSTSPEQYVDSQVLLLQSPAVAERAVAIANAALRRGVFVAADFNGESSSLKVTSQTATDPNSNVVDVSFSAQTGADAAAGANAVVDAYAAVRSAQINQADSSLISAIDSTVRNIDAQLADVTGRGGAVSTELATSLVNERSNLLQQRSLAVIDEQVSASQALSIVPALSPSRAANHKLTKTAPIGAVVGFVLGTCLAYRLEIRKRRRSSVAVRAHVPHPVAAPVPPRALNPERPAIGEESGNGHSPSPRLDKYDPRYEESPEAFVRRTAAAIYRSRLTELQTSLPEGTAEPAGTRAD